MPEHVHLLLTPADDITVSKLFEGLKRETSLALNQFLRRSGRLWLAGGGHDRNIVSREHYTEKVEYIHTNPVSRGLADVSFVYKHSSAAAYEGVEYSGPEITFLATDHRW